MLAVENIDARREAIALKTPAKHKSLLGQFMTPQVISKYMASMFDTLQGKEVRLLDAGAGIGSLTAAFAQRLVAEKGESLTCEAWEIDSKLHDPLSLTLDSCSKLAEAQAINFSAKIQSDDFILAFDNLFSSQKISPATHAILNPPYKKIRSDSVHRRALSDCGIETSNLYSAFVSLALKVLEDKGELVAITPRSFCNGSYFRPFRELMLAQSSLSKIHVFESRTNAFKGDEVLQENVIFHLVKGGTQGPVVITTSSDASFSDLASQVKPFDKIVFPDDRNMVFHLDVEIATAEVLEAERKYHYKLEDIGISVSTGPVVDFRMRDHLRSEPGPEIAPLVYAHHYVDGFVVHPKLDAKKPNFIEINDSTRKWLVPTGCYVCVRRLSSKEEKRRIIPAVFNPSATPGELIGLDNHMNFFHQTKRGMPEELARGLAIYLGSTFADKWLRRFSGHTQVNAGDLRTLRYPPVETLVAWGKEALSTLGSQAAIDNLVGGVSVKD